MIKISSRFSETDHIKLSVDVIEKTLESFGLVVRVVEINIEKTHIDYYCDVAVGTDLEEIEKHAKDLALALASPTGKVKLLIPIPGKAQIGIQVPKPSKEYYENAREKDEEMLNARATWNEKIAFALFILARVIEIIAARFYKISHKEEISK